MKLICSFFPVETWICKHWQMLNTFKGDAICNISSHFKVFQNRLQSDRSDKIFSNSSRLLNYLKSLLPSNLTNRQQLRSAQTKFNFWCSVAHGMERHGMQWTFHTIQYGVTHCLFWYKWHFLIFTKCPFSSFYWWNLYLFLSYLYDDYVNIVQLNSKVKYYLRIL